MPFTMTKICGSASIIIHGHRRPTFSMVKTMEILPKVLCAAWAWDNVVVEKAARCARATWSLVKKNIQHAAGRDCYLKCCRAKSSATVGAVRKSKQVWIYV